MGIDAEMLIRIRGQKPTEDQIARWSWDLSAATNPSYFFTDADGKFHNGKIQRALGFSYGRDEEGDYIGSTEGKVWCQDGPDILADDDEWFLEVHLMGRYYGIGYERGDLLAYCAIAEWIEMNIPDASVWYGGDSSGVCAEPFGASERYKLKRHLNGNHGRDYFNSFSRYAISTPKPPKPCGLCIPGEPRFTRYGWGGINDSYVAMSCAGCGKYFESRDGGENYEEKQENA